MPEGGAQREDLAELLARRGLIAATLAAAPTPEPVPSGRFVDTW